MLGALEKGEDSRIEESRLEKKEKRERRVDLPAGREDDRRGEIQAEPHFDQREEARETPVLLEPPFVI